VLLDIADGWMTFSMRRCHCHRLPDAEQLVTPSVLDELAYLADSGLTPQVRRSAGLAIRLLRNKDRFRPFLNCHSRRRKPGDWPKNSAAANCCRMRRFMIL